MDTLLNDVEAHATKILSQLPPAYLYHNLNHTQRVVKYTKELSEGSGLNKENLNLLLIAAWFHDLGYVEARDEHEKKSAALAEAYLKEKKADAKDTEKVKRLILATRMGYEPKNVGERIIRDADSAHIADKSYVESSQLLRLEWEQTEVKTFDDIGWTEANIGFFTRDHRFYTDYALLNWQSGKEKNLAGLFKRLKKQKQEAKREKKKDEELKLKISKARLPERGIETMFRVTMRNHITLSDIADTKANILLSVNAIIVSLALSSLLPKLDNPSNTYLIVPTVVFVLFTIASMVLSVLATRPNVTQGRFTQEDVEKKRVNLLFFGNFHQMQLSEFEWAMNEMMGDKKYLYSSMTKDLYFLGRVLHRKYKILRVTYTVFIVGIIISVTIFGIAFALTFSSTEAAV